jgi:hypothetical protein
MSLSPSRIDEFKYRENVAPVRSMIRDSFRDEPSGARGLNGHSVGGGHGDHQSHRMVRRSPSVAKERTRDDLIDSIVHTRTREHRVMPGFHNASDWEERKAMRIDCDKVQCRINALIISRFKPTKILLLWFPDYVTMHMAGITYYNYYRSFRGSSWATVRLSRMWST